MVGLRAQLRKHTAAAHERLDERPLFVALAAGDLALETYVAWLRSLAVYYGALERAVERSPDPRVHAIHDPAAAKSPLLRDDLAAVDQIGKHTAGHLAPTLTVAERLSDWSRDDAAAVLGAAYVLEGAVLGATVLAPSVAPLRRRAGLGPSYVERLADRTAARWSRVCAHLDDVKLDASERRQSLVAAEEIFELIDAAVVALQPAEAEHQAPVHQLNRDAGQHPITTDPRELLAAVEAGKETWAAFPYYEARYGERGRRFTRSDSAWLVTLAFRPAAVRTKHLDWLVEVLAMRGMPSLLMATHLRALARHLEIEVPDRAEAYATLRDAAAHIETRRRSVLPDPIFHRLVETFDRDEPLAGIGPLLVAAVGDEASGMEGAVDALVDWLADPKRFDAKWCHQVHLTVDRARAAIA